MSNKQQVLSRPGTTKKPPKRQISEEEFRRRLVKINEWRKQRLAELRAKVECRCKVIENAVGTGSVSQRIMD
jgi:hypothetical protein